MSNSYFQFKQFRIEQGAAAMKVSTDACIQGAWTPVASDTQTVLDIGAGTGLLSLMLAQRNNSITIDAIEIDEDAAGQAVKNMERSAWKERIKILSGDVRHYSFNKRYDLIITNPPFFRDSLQGPDARRNQARHGLSLSLEDLLPVLDRCLAIDGYASVLLPAAETEVWKDLLLRNHWGVSCQLSIRPRVDMEVNRIVSLCCRNGGAESTREELVIYQQIGVYTEEFSRLLGGFYLHL